MNDKNQREEKSKPSAGPVQSLAALALLSGCAYAAIAALSGQFKYETPGADRPIPAVLLLFGLALACYFAAIRVAARAPRDRRLLGVIVGAAVAFRAVLLFSVPIQEVDIYRYVWDGAVSSSGVSPFRYSPRQVQTAAPGENLPADLSRLVLLRDESPALGTILERIHYGALPTIYPPTSQTVFWAAAMCTPHGASVRTHLIVMKALLVVFDLATVAVVLALLKLAGRPPGLCIIYAWCPLLMKEVANSGHLDALAVFLTTLGVYLTARAVFSSAAPWEREPDSKTYAWGYATAAAVVLALAVGAKLYPVVLAPLILLTLARRCGPRAMVVPGAALALLSFLLLAPMLPSTGQRRSENSAAVLLVAPPAAEEPVPAFPPPEESASDGTQQDARPATDEPPEDDPSRGLVTFLRHWEMNDFIFLLLVENLKPMAEAPREKVAWFSIVPESTRTRWADAVARHMDVDGATAGFLLSRAITALAFLVVGGLLAWRGAAARDTADWLRAAFLTVAWFWLLCPTQNPWYWTWALPLLPFARGRAWLVMSGLVLVYYLRFWLGYHWPTAAVPGTHYFGHEFFDFIVTWLEYAPWFIWLAAERFWPRSA